MIEKPGLGRVFCYAGKWLFPLQNARPLGIQALLKMPASHENPCHLNGLRLGLLSRGDSLRVKGNGAKIFRSLCIEPLLGMLANRIR